MINLEHREWPSSPLKAKTLNADQLKQFLNIRADYEKAAFVTAGHFEVRALGAKEFTRPIPPDESGITALLAHSTGHIYGGTGGKAAHLFFYNPAPDADAVADIGTIPGAIAVAALCELPDGTVLGAANTAENTSVCFIYKSCQVLLREKDFTGMGVREIFDLPAEDQLFFSCIDPCHSSGTITLMPSPVSNKIEDMKLSQDGTVAYFLESKTGKIFSMEIAGGKGECIGQLDANGYFSPRLAMDNLGRLYGAGLYGQVIQYSPDTHSFIKLPLSAPAFKGQELYNRVTAWCQDKNGAILYGGTESGIAFRYDTENGVITTLGRPCAQGRINAMARSGKRIFMLAGEVDDCAHLASYNDETRDLLDLGCPMARSERPWYGYRFEAMTTGRNGVIFMGEYDRISQLFMFFPSVE